MWFGDKKYVGISCYLLQRDGQGILGAAYVGNTLMVKENGSMGARF